MRLFIAFVVCLWATAPATLGAAQDMSEAQKAAAWLKETVGIPAERIVLLGPNTLVALKTIEPRPPSNFHLMVHIENFGTSLDPPSEDLEFLVNCPSRRFHVDRIEIFTESGGRGVQSSSFGPSDWTRAMLGSQQDRIIGAVCDPPQTHVAAVPSPAPIVADSGQAPRRMGTVQVQLIAAGSRAAATQFAAALPTSLSLPPDQVSIQEALVGGRTYYRLIVSGFAGKPDAAAFCAKVKGTGRDCFIRPQ